MAFPLNAQQIACLDRHLHIAVTANAGSGKTAVLVERYLRIAIEDGVSVENIVAITFTKRAAAEMRERIHKRILELINDPEPWVLAAANNDVDHASDVLRRLLRSLGKVRISTFHSFCAGLVRQYADVVGHPHTVRDLDEVEGPLLQTVAVSNVLKRSLTEGNPIQDAILRLAESIAVDTARTIMRSIVRDHARAEKAKALLSMSEADQLDAAFAGVAEIQYDLLNQLLQLLIDSLASYNIYPCYQTISEDLLSVKADLLQNEFTPAMHKQCLTTIEQYFVKKDQSVRKAVVDKQLWLEGTIPAPPPGSKSLYEFITKDWDRDSEEKLASIVRTVMQLGLDAFEEYRSLKRERGAIDFSDMISDALRLLRNEEIAAQIRAGITHIMIDEFQDTDPTQFEVLELLAPDLAGGTVRGPFVFVVGDDKQSIYQFRNADVRLFRKARTAIASTNLQRGNDDGLRKLTWSYRMHPDLCVAINAACTSIFYTAAQINERSYHVEYEPLVAASETSSEMSVQRFRILELPEHSLQEDAGNEEDDNDAATDEFAVVAAETLRMLQRPDRPIQPKDIAVLVLKNAQKAKVAEELRKLGIPCTIYGGRSFFSRPEIADIRNAIKACVDRQDDLSTAAVMRSPLLQCTDIEILIASAAAPYSSIQDGLANLVNSNFATAAQIRAHAFFETYTQQIFEQPAHRIIEAMLHSTSWYATIAGNERSEQMRGNADKLITLCRELEDIGGTTISDVLMAIAVPAEDKEAEAPVLSSDNAVHVMTIHLSKGLEFDAVILAGLNSKAKPQVYQESTELGITVNLPLKFRSVSDAISTVNQAPPLSHAANTRISSTRKQAENNRLAYVALTRAKEEVLITLPASWSSATANLNGIAPVFARAASAYTGAQILTATVANDSRYEPFDAPNGAVLDYTSPLPPLAPRTLTPSATLAKWTGHTHSSGESSASQIGTAVHAALAHVLPLLESLDEEQVLSAIVSSVYQSGLPKSIVKDVTLEIRSVVQSPLLMAHAHRLSGARIEQQLVAVAGDTLLYGHIDVRFPSDNGIVELWDWKTSAVENQSDIAEHCKHYASQMKAYAELCFAADATCHTVLARLIYTKAFDKGLIPDHVMTFTRPMLL